MKIHRQLIVLHIVKTDKRNKSQKLVYFSKLRIMVVLFVVEYMYIPMVILCETCLLFLQDYNKKKSGKGKREINWPHSNLLCNHYNSIFFLF